MKIYNNFIKIFRFFKKAFFLKSCKQLENLLILCFFIFKYLKIYIELCFKLFLYYIIIFEICFKKELKLYFILIILLFLKQIYKFEKNT